jgi:general stress protein 26
VDRKPGIGILVAWVLASSLLSFPLQELEAQTAFPRDTLLGAARGIMASARYCALVTFDEGGGPRVRAMDPFPPDSDMTIWMGTNRKTRKVSDIGRDPRVTLYYYSPDAVGYVTVTGTARLVDDAEEKAIRWKTEWEAFYQDRASEYLLIQVTPGRLEVVDYSRGIVGDPDTWEPPFVEFRGGSPGS